MADDAERDRNLRGAADRALARRPGTSDRMVSSVGVARFLPADLALLGLVGSRRWRCGTIGRRRFYLFCAVWIASPSCRCSTCVPSARWRWSRIATFIWRPCRMVPRARRTGGFIFLPIWRHRIGRWRSLPGALAAILYARGFSFMSKAFGMTRSRCSRPASKWRRVPIFVTTASAWH